MRFLIIITTLIFFSCKSSEKPTAEESHTPKVESKDPVKTDIVEFTILKEGTNSGFKTAENKVINSTEELSKVWGVLFQNYMEIATLPKVDFRAYSVILITMGEQTSGGYTINVKSILNSKSEEKVVVNESKPGASCMTTSVMTYPFQLIMLPKTAGKISFEREESIYECDK